jgi:hypothetical protein
VSFSPADNPPWINAQAEVCLLAPREGYCFHHVQAIIVSIDQYDEMALGNREFFLNKPTALEVEETITSLIVWKTSGRY